MILSVAGMHFSYPSRKVLEDISFSINVKDCVAVLGTNGTGKSTLLKNLARILKPQNGTIFLNEKEFSNLSNLQIAKNIGFVAQHHQMVRTTVFDAVLLGRKPYIRWDASEKDLEIVNNTIEALGLSPYAMRFTDELSGGELQKVVIARAIAQEPKVLLLDEPTSNLDIRNQIETIGVIRQIIEQKDISVIVAMHDINLAMRFADRFLLMKKGRIYAAGGREVISAENIYDVYGINASVHKIDDAVVVIPKMNE